MKSVNLKLLTCLAMAGSVAAMELPPSSPQNNKRKAPDSEIAEGPEEKKAKIEAILIAKNAQCPICQEDAQKISTANPNNIAATACCNEFMCKECFDSLHAATQDISKIMNNPADRANFVDTYNFEPNQLSQVKYPLCKKQPFKILPATFEYSDIFVAIKAGDVEAVKQFIDAGTDIHCTNKKGFTPLHIASRLGHNGIVQLLVDHKANVNSGQRDFTFDPNLENGLTPLHSATEGGYLNTVELLLKNGAEVNGNDADTPATPLHIACQNNNISIVQTLLQHNADVNLTDSDANFPIEVVLEGDNYPDETSQLNMIKMLLDHGSDLEAGADEAGTPLLIAASNGQLLIVKELLKRGANIHAIDSGDETSLHYASKNNRPKVIEELLAHGANINDKNDQGCTPLHGAAEDHCLEATHTLLMRGANINSQDNKGQTPLHKATQELKPTNQAKHKSIIKVIQALLKSEADLHIKDKEGREPLQCIAPEFLKKVFLSFK